MSRLFTKSLLLSYRQCPKKFHREYHHPELVPAKGSYDQFLSERGDQVTSFAQKEFSSGVEVPFTSMKDLAEKTQEYLKQNVPLFEAGFIYEDFQVRVDILNLKTLIEVKSGTKLEDRYVEDAAIQGYILEKTGYALDRIMVWHLNKECALPNLTNLFNKVDITDQARALYPEIERNIKTMKALVHESEPVVSIGPHCSNPYDCPFKDQCFKERGLEELSVLNIPRVGAKGWKLLDQGITSLSQVKAEDFTANQARMIRAHQTGERFLDLKTLESVLGDWKFPLYFVDFEALEYDLPGFMGSRPGQQIPFQVSIHRWMSIKDPIEKVADYLHPDLSDPRPLVSSFLCQHLPEKGSLLAYNAGYEKNKIKDLILHSTTEESLKLTHLLDRFEDPLPFIRETVYDVGFKGSYSIKTVAPSLLGEEASYSHLVIKDGTEAMVAYRQYLYANLNVSEREKIRQDLLAYCNQDTLVLAKIVLFMYNLAYGN